MTAELLSEIPARAGNIVALLVHQGKLILACEFGVYELTEAAYPEPRKLREIMRIPWPGDTHD
jgi:hypothetical protein